MQATSVYRRTKKRSPQLTLPLRKVSRSDAKTSSRYARTSRYADVMCQVQTEQTYPYKEVYLKRNTQIPLRSTQIVRRGWNIVQETTGYTIISMGNPNEKYFDSIPKDWSLIYRDAMLELLYCPQILKIDLNQSAELQVWPIIPPYRINRNDTVIIQ